MAPGDFGRAGLENANPMTDVLVLIDRSSAVPSLPALVGRDVHAVRGRHRSDNGERKARSCNWAQGRPTRLIELAAVETRVMEQI